MGKLVAGSKVDRGSRCLGMSDIRWVADGIIIKIRYTKIDRLGLGQEVHLCFADHPPCPCVMLQEYLDRCVLQQAVLLVH